MACPVPVHLGKLILTNPLQSWNAYDIIVVQLGKSTLVNEAQFLKALLPIYVHFGKLIEDKDVQKRNAFSATETHFGKIALVKPMQLEKHPLPIE